MTAARRTELARQAARAAARRRALAVWQERFDVMLRTPTRTASERLAKLEALALMERARPDLR